MSKALPESLLSVARRPAAKLALLPLIAAAVYARDPRVFDSPRFWAEEGSGYFQSALAHPGAGALVRVTAVDYAPYVHPIPQLATWVAANWVSLEHAPVVTTAAWAVVALAVFCIAIWSKAELVSGPLRRALAVAALLLAVSNSENWVNTLGAHVWADLGMLLLVLEAERVTGRRRVAGLAGFATLALLSPTSWMLLPATIALCAHAWRSHRAYLVALGSAVGLQVAARAVLFASSPRHPASIPEAGHLIVSKLLLWPLVGPELAERYVQWALGLSAGAFSATGFAVALGLVVLVIVFARASRRDPTTSALLWTHLTATAGFVFLGLHVGRDLLPLFSGARYTWLPNALLILLIGHQLDGALIRARKPSQLVLAATLAASVLVGVTQYRYPQAIRDWSRAPDWRSEVAHHGENPKQTALGIAPMGWRVVLPR